MAEYLIYNSIDGIYIPQSTWENAVKHAEYMAREHPGYEFPIYRLVDCKENNYEWKLENCLKEKNDA